MNFLFLIYRCFNNQKFRAVGTVNGNPVRVPDSDRIFDLKRPAGQFNPACYQKNKKAFIYRMEEIFQFLTLIKISEGNLCILIDPAMFRSFFTRNNGCQFIFPAFFWKMPG